MTHDIIVRYNDAQSLLGGKTACDQKVVPKFPTRFVATRRPMATQEMGKTLVFNLYKFQASEKFEAYFNSPSFKAYITRIGKYRR